MRHNRLFGLVAAALALAPLGAFSAELPLGTGVTGSTPSNPRLNPTEILSSVAAQELILAISSRPHTRAEIEAATSGMFFTIDDMVAVGLLREESELFWLDFNLLRLEDQARILDLTESMGRDLAEAFLAHQQEFEALAGRHDQPHDVAAELLYLVVGCFSLDWDGLDLTEERGWRDAAQRTIEGHAFTPWAKEKGAEVDLKRLYWGSHSSSAGEFQATTFGDHDALPRFGLPDLLWRSGRAYSDIDDADARRAAAYVMSSYSKDALSDAVQVLVALRNENLDTEALAKQTDIATEKLDRLLALLAEAEYIESKSGAWEALIPILLPGDAPTVEAIVAAGREIMMRWHEENYARIRDELSDLTPGRNGVPFERVYTEVWHFAFGIANRTLVESGLFADPYAEDRRHKGFIPAIWASALVE